VQFTCSGAPAQSTCSVSPNSITLKGSSPETVTVTVTTAGSSAALTRPIPGSAAKSPFGLWAVFFGTLALTSIGGMTSKMRCRRAWRVQLGHRLMLLTLLAAAITMVACGAGNSSSGGGGGGTPAGTYTLTVTGGFSKGSATLTHSTKLTLVVQ